MTRPPAAVILAAGRGSRLGAATLACPKALLPLGPPAPGAAAPPTFLSRQCELLRAVGVAELVVVAGYLHEQVAAALQSFAPDATLVLNDTPEIRQSGSLHSLQLATRSVPSLLDGRGTTLFMDADIVYHSDVLRRLLADPASSSLLVCRDHDVTGEEVLVFGTGELPRCIGKGLTPALLPGMTSFGEAVGIVKLGPEHHALVQASLAWLLGDPDAPVGSAAHAGYGPARRATEHEELTQHLMRCDALRCVTFGSELPFVEVDDAREYARLKDEIYPRLLRLEAEGAP